MKVRTRTTQEQKMTPIENVPFRTIKKHDQKQYITSRAHEEDQPTHYMLWTYQPTK